MEKINEAKLAEYQELLQGSNFKVNKLANDNDLFIMDQSEKNEAKMQVLTNRIEALKIDHKGQIKKFEDYIGQLKIDYQDKLNHYQKGIPNYETIDQQKTKIDNLTWQLDVGQVQLKEANEKVWALTAKIDEDKDKVAKVDMIRSDFVKEIQYLRKELKFFETGKQNQINLIKSQFQDELNNLIVNQSPNKGHLSNKPNFYNYNIGTLETEQSETDQNKQVSYVKNL